MYKTSCLNTKHLEKQGGYIHITAVKFRKLE